MTAVEQAPAMERAPALELRSITKRFGSFVADDDVSLRLEQGEVHALVGENGAGKSTLMNMCFGILQPSEGAILVGGRELSLPSPTAAREHGIGMVHQHFKLVPSLTVAENVFLGAEIVGRGRSLDQATMRRGLREVSERYGLAVDPAARIQDLSAGVRQRVEILKALYFDAKVLILDEPTAVLTPQETDRLLLVLRDLAADGRSVLLVTHKLREVMAVADRFSVLRRGRIVATGRPAESSEHEIAALMVGREVSLARTEPIRAQRVATETVLAIRGLSVASGHGAPAVDRVDLDVRRGEIIGIAGVEGNGQTELIRAIAGLDPASGGAVELLGHDVTSASPAQRREFGLAHIPEDRLATGVAAPASIADNVSGGRMSSNLFPRGWYRAGFARQWADGLIEQYDVRGASPSTPIGNLSGGNMQKVIVARELDPQPDVLLAAQPTRGVDIGASEFIHGRLRELRDAGAGILLVSADLNELLALSDRIVVMYRGSIAARFLPDEELVPGIGLAMAGAADPRDAQSFHGTAKAPGGSRPDAIDEAHGPADAGAADAAGRSDAASAARRRARTVVVRGSGAGSSARTAVRPAAALSAASARVAAALTQPLLAVVAALLVGAVIIVSIGDDPTVAYRSLLIDIFSNEPGVSSVLAQATPLLLVAISAFVAFRSGVLNIGGEGQLYVGAFGCALTALYLPDGVPGPILIVLSLLAGGVAGAIWGLIPGMLNAYLNVDILVTSLMFSYIAQQLTAYFINSHLRDPGTGVPASRLLPADSALPKILGQGGATVGILIGVGATVIAALLMLRTRWGLAARFLGANREFAQYLGVSVKAKTMQVMSASGFLAGIAGGVATLGVEHRFNQQFSPGYGFLGLTVALLGRLNPVGILLAAVLYGALEAGSTLMQINTGVPLALVNVLEGVVVVLTTAAVVRFGNEVTWGALWRRLSRSRAPGAASSVATEA